MPQYQSARSSTTRHTYLLVLCPVHIPPVHMPQSTYPSPHTPRPHIIITIYSTKLYQKISWVCCRLYCYECAAQVTMPTATNKWTLPHPHSQTLSDTPTVSFQDLVIAIIRIQLFMCQPHSQGSPLLECKHTGKALYLFSHEHDAIGNRFRKTMFCTLFNSWCVGYALPNS